MGNCSVKADTEECGGPIRVLTDAGAVLLLKGPKTAQEVLKDYPGYGIFQRGQASSPLSNQEHLAGGQFYHLRQLHEVQVQDIKAMDKIEAEELMIEDELSNKPRDVAASDFVENLSCGSGSAVEVLPSNENGIWRVKLVIDTKQLEEILSQQVNTEALIEKMRMAASASSSSPRSERTKTSWRGAWKPRLSTAFRVPNATRNNKNSYRVST